MRTVFNLKGLYEKYGLKHKSGDIVFFEGDSGEDFYIVYSGTVKVVKFKGGNMLTLRILKEGCIFGEFAFFSDNVRTATVIAHSDVELIKLNNKNLSHILNSNAEFVWYFMTALSEKLEHSFELIDVFAIGTIEKKLFKYLIYMVNRKGVQVNIRELQDLIGESKYEIIPIIDMWKKLGIIGVEAGQVVSVNEVLVKQIATHKGEK